MAVKTFTTGLAPDGNAPPFGADAPPFPRRGNFSCRLALGLMSTTKYHAAKISPSGGDVAAGDRRGAFPMWRPCRGSPSRAKLVPGLHIKGLSNKSPDRCRRRGFTVLPPTGGIINSLPLKGKRLTTFCASLTFLHPLLSLTHWIFRSLTLPYKSSSHSAKCVRCAPQSGNPQPSGPKAPSNLRTLRPIGPVNPKNLPLRTFFWEPSGPRTQNVLLLQFPH